MDVFSIDETIEYAKGLAKDAKPGDIYALIGPMGAGKTAFTKAFAKGLGVGETVNSPTYTIVQEYTDGRLPLYHFDVYRIEEEEELFEVGIEDYLYGEGVCLIEWADKFPDTCMENAKVIKIEITGENERRISLLGEDK